MSYRDGFEDAVELCIAETKDSNEKTDAVQKMMKILALVKEDKFEKIKQMLGCTR